MQKILVIGAGRSSSSLIKYLQDHSKKENWQVSICDQNVKATRKKFPGMEVISFDIHDAVKSIKEIQKADLIVSMLPADLHIKVAEICASEGKHLLTASYMTDEIKSLDDDFKSGNALCVMEMGLDPGIDHMSAMKVLSRIKNEGNKINT